MKKKDLNDFDISWAVDKKREIRFILMGWILLRYIPESTSFVDG